VPVTSLPNGCAAADHSPETHGTSMRCSFGSETFWFISSAPWISTRSCWTSRCMRNAMGLQPRASSSACCYGIRRPSGERTLTIVQIPGLMLGVCGSRIACRWPLGIAPLQINKAPSQ
jgi:hypothetical protein